jgi:adenine-specific DNA-methyltransferase
MSKQLKLELNWFNKDKKIIVEPRILIENKDLSFAIKNLSIYEILDNYLIHGDNLLALKALESNFTNAIKCIYIDPPYNTGSAFEHYDDNFEHSSWLSLIKPRLEIMRKLLKEDGTIWISIDADESHYLKVLCDEVFGRNNFIDEIVWQRSYSPINLKKTLSRAHDTILVYSKNMTPNFELNKLPRTVKANNRYKNYDNDYRGPWKSSDLSVGPIVKDKIYEITTPSGRKVLPPEGYCWRLTKERFAEYVRENRIWFGDKGDNVPSIKRFLSEVKDGVTSVTWWSRDEVGDNQEAKKEIKQLFKQNVFGTPKSERLIQRIITLATNPGDLVLDSFLGSGTTAAVAHKMGRRWIGVEMGNHAYTHCKVRLDKVIDGTDQGGITKAVNWNGGGGYRFYELAPTLIKKDNFGQHIINPLYNPEMLASAIAKHEGYVYSPDDNIYWKQSKTNENSFLFVTTNHMSREVIESINQSMAEGEYLLIVCRSYDRTAEKSFKNIRMKKMPQSLLKNCEFDVENYNLNIINPPAYEEDEMSEEEGGENNEQKDKYSTC